MRHSLLFVALLLLFFTPLPAVADPVPGDACSTPNNVTQSTGPELSGAGHWMVCQGGTWKTLLSFNNTAQVTKIGDQTCGTNEILKFDGTKWACAVESGGGGGGGGFVTADQSKTNSTTLTNITDLSADVIAGKNYQVELVLYTSQNPSGGFKGDLGGGTAAFSSVLGDCHLNFYGSGDGAGYCGQFSSTTSTYLNQTAGDSAYSIHLIGFLTASSSGTLIPRFAQSVSNGTPTKVLKGSHMIVRELVSGGGGADPCAGSPSPGDVCANGSVYAGQSPDGNVAMYTTPADAGAFTWNNGSSNWVDTAMSNSSYITGEAHTTFLVGLSNSESPYAAATYCDGLSAHGETDWYLPARDELTVLYTNRVAIGGFNTSGSNPAGWYWSSSEGCNDCAWYKNFNSGSQTPDWKDYGLSVRCVRKD